MLCFIIFHWPVITKIFIAGRKCHSLNMQVSMFIDVWWLHAVIPCACVWSYNFNLQPVGIGRVQNDMQACIQLFLEAFSLFFVFSVQTKPNKTLQLNLSPSKQRNHSNAEICLPYSNLPFKQFIPSWSVWSNSAPWQVVLGGKFQSVLMC